LAIKSPIWEVKKTGDCRKIILSGVAEGITEIKVNAQDGYEITENPE